MKVFLLIFLSLGFALVKGSENSTEQSPKQDDPDNIITNGYPAYQGKAPYIVSLILGTDSSNDIGICGGIIISNFWVLTAAHCLTADYVDIHYGSNRRENGQFVHRVENDRFIRHHLWPNTNGNDIGLIYTPFVDFTSFINKVNLPSLNQRYEEFEDQWAVACGWGGKANGQQADWLQCVDLQIISNDECSRAYGSLPEGILCVKTPAGKSTCGGDFGGPLVTYDNPVLVGIASFVSGGGCTAGHPAGFTRVTAHLDWIRQNTGIAYY